MRIITGTARGTTLQTLDGEATRPTPERVKEAVFSMIQFDIEGRRVLDLFGGSGQMALEALSRGARTAVIVDESAEAVRVIRENAQKTKLFSACRLIRSSHKEYLRGAKGREVFDIVFLDPPYAEAETLRESLELLVRYELLAQNALVICETDRKEPMEAEGLRVLRHNRYGRVFITLLTNAPEQTEEE
ncbi:MAG: 16S rRNA (guanine(966)-N(2))-methyltransferase RsmD [Ruminococcaceae bacterium]|nr:16S rRNA (guanine(966)-N(2))-methyltransferase RsmD [Oscillospiraceae bacterium]